SAHRRRIREREPLKNPGRLVANVEAAPAEEVTPLPSDQTKRDLVLLTLFDDELPGGLDDVRVEAAAQSAVRADDNQQRPRSGRGGNTQQRVCVLIDARH